MVACCCDVLQGVYSPVYTTADPLTLNTSALGTFSVKSPSAGIYRFSSSYPGSVCKDTVSNVLVSFPMSVKLPPTSKAAVTAISLLTRPASRNPDVVEKLGDISGLPVSLWNYAYGLFGYDASKSNVSEDGVGNLQSLISMPIRCHELQVQGLLRTPLCDLLY